MNNGMTFLKFSLFDSLNKSIRFIIQYFGFIYFECNVRHVVINEILKYL